MFAFWEYIKVSLGTIDLANTNLSYGFSQSARLHSFGGARYFAFLHLQPYRRCPEYPDCHRWRERVLKLDELKKLCVGQDSRPR